MKENDERGTMNDELFFYSAFIVPRSSFIVAVPRS
jgi:hypothetical protein